MKKPTHIHHHNPHCEKIIDELIGLKVIVCNLGFEKPATASLMRKHINAAIRETKKIK